MPRLYPVYSNVAGDQSLGYVCTLIFLESLGLRFCKRNRCYLFMPESASSRAYGTDSVLPIPRLYPVSNFRPPDPTSSAATKKCPICSPPILF